jgi:hypothetical protein
MAPWAVRRRGRAHPAPALLTRAQGQARRFGF